MNIAVDATPLLKKPDGVGRYSTSIVKALLTLDTHNSYAAIAFIDDKLKHHNIPSRELRYTYLPVPRRIYSQWFKQITPLSVNRWLSVQPDAVFYPNFVNFPKIKNAKEVLVIHDTAFLEQPETLARRGFGPAEKLVPKRFVTPNLWYLNTFVPRAIKRADVIVAVSEETREAIARHYSINASEIIVVPNAVDESFFVRHSTVDLQRTAGKYGLPDSYILFLGTIEPRKNLVNLLEAYAQLPKEIRDAFPLVLAGKPGWNNQPIYRRINELLADGCAILTVGFVDDEDLPRLYRRASIFVFPSVHEGFGLPILEAMAARTPVVTSDLSPMNRLAEDAAVFFDPHEPKSIADAIEKVLLDKALADSMIKKGMQVANKHTWRGSAEILLGAINQLSGATSANSN